MAVYCTRTVKVDPLSTKSGLHVCASTAGLQWHSYKIFKDFLVQDWSVSLSGGQEGLA